MTTKEMERKALEKIRKIVEELGENSYVGTAFEGCFEIAEENIENDFACSMKQRLETSEKENAGLIKSVAEYQNRVKTLEMRAGHLEDSNLAYGKEAEKMVEKIKGLTESATKYWNDLQAAETKLDEKEDEIIRLKAKLYDLMTK